MFTVIVFPVKPESKDYPFYKSPKKVLEIEDGEAMTYTSHTKGVYYLTHHINDMDNLPDKDLVDYFNNKNNMKVLINSRKTGNGYSTENKEYFVRIIRQKK